MERIFFSGKVECFKFRHSDESSFRFSDLLVLEQKIVSEFHDQKRSKEEGVLILCEVAPVVTTTLKTNWETDFIVSDPREALKQKGVDLFEVNRGGKATYHGPGQWVLFPVGPLEFWTGSSVGIRKMIEGLLEAARATSEKCLKEWGLDSKGLMVRDGDERGLWLGEEKVGSVGIRVEQRLVRHGLSLSVFNTPQSFFGIHPCGLSEKKPGALFLPKTGLEAEGRFLRAGELLLSEFERVFAR